MGKPLSGKKKRTSPPAKSRSLPRGSVPAALAQEIRATELHVQQADKDFAEANVRRMELRRLSLGPDTIERIEIIARYESARRELSKAKARMRELLAARARKLNSHGAASRPAGRS